MLEQYFDVDEKSIGFFFGLVVGAIVVVTLIYWLVFGFDRWTGEMQRASDLMTAAATAPREAPCSGGCRRVPLGGTRGSRSHRRTLGCFRYSRGAIPTAFRNWRAK